jgi:MoxR-like ATPase
VHAHQAPVRAALHGRLLILDGLEKAERNVLPTLNNLLENRELSLDDGSILVSPRVYDHHFNNINNSDNELILRDTTSTPQTILRVHPDFRVAALGSGPHATDLDPPLRSRFQARVMDHLDPGEMLEALCAATSQGDDNLRKIKDIVIESSATKKYSFGSLLETTKYITSIKNEKHCITVKAALSARDGMTEVAGGITATDVSPSNHDTTSQQQIVTKSHSNFVETPSIAATIVLIGEGLRQSRAVACIGPKGCGKSMIAIQAASKFQRQSELFSLFKDMTSRDLLLRRSTDNKGNTIWNQTPLTRAAVQGSWVILDGIDKLASDTLTSLARLIEQGEVDLPDGTRIVAHPSFRCIALAHPPIATNWITPEINGMFHWIRVQHLPTTELQSVISLLFPRADRKEIGKLIRLRDRLERAASNGAADTVEERENLALSLRKLKHICRRLERYASDLYSLVQEALMTNLMSDRGKSVVLDCMKDCGITRSKKALESDNSTTILDKSLIESYKRKPAHPLLVPKPHFEENPGHNKVIQELLEAHIVGERALLIMGYQGVGKNRVTDYLLSLLHCEREYVQLHRDTTVQTMLSSTSVEGGCIVYGDSPLVRAAINGRVLVIDEADKAPVEVVALLKGLIEDGELALPDGRILKYDDYSGGLKIHPYFRIWALANPAGYPFQGNDLAKEMADVFSCHVVPPLDRRSQEHVLNSYGSRVAPELISTVVSIWQDLESAHKKGVLAYPFSVREAVSVVRHLNEFPSEGLLESIENVISFDRFDEAVFNQLAAIIAPHGVQLKPKKSVERRNRGEGGISTPRTRTSSPKHGRVDPKNLPHVGGNQWAGGSGGSDTAGLGGRGGPYRIDSGHPVHQVTDEMKAQVSSEAFNRAREMAREGLKDKLEELKMKEFDWKRYGRLKNHVSLQISQLQVQLKGVTLKKDQRAWLKRQYFGELDDNRLVDALAGEKDVFKKRGVIKPIISSSSRDNRPMSIKLVADVSASMYRFNGTDGRLNRLLEATFMLMESLQGNSSFQLQIVGHNGTSAKIPLMALDTAKDPSTQLRILDEMVAHTQYTWAGDNTIKAIELAVLEGTPGELILVISDANLNRYQITPRDISGLINQNGVHVHLVLIGGGNEAQKLASAIPNGRAHVCFHSDELPLILKKIIADATK